MFKRKKDNKPDLLIDLYSREINLLINKAAAADPAECKELNNLLNDHVNKVINLIYKM